MNIQYICFSAGARERLWRAQSTATARARENGRCARLGRLSILRFAFRNAQDF